MADKKQQESSLTPAETVDRIWDLAKKIDFCMFGTWDGDKQRVRPLSARVFREEHAIYFLVSAEGEKNWQVEQFPQVSLSFADTSNMKYVAIAGTAKVTNDRAKIHELWSEFDKAWWESEKDPDIRLLTVTPEDGELWDSPGKIVAFAAMLTAAVTGAQPKFGENAKAGL